MVLRLAISAFLFVQASPGQLEGARAGGVDVLKQLDAARTRAFSLPPELGADYLYETGTRLPLTGEQRIELVRQILEMARQAEHPVSLDFAGGINADSVAARTVEASTQGLDHASLVGRALVLLGPASAEITREALDELLRLRLPETGCETCFSADPRVIYTTFAREIVHAYSPEERKEEQHLDPIRRAVLSMHSPAQIYGVATLLAALDLSPRNVVRSSDSSAARFRRSPVTTGPMPGPCPAARSSIPYSRSPTWPRPTTPSPTSGGTT